MRIFGCASKKSSVGAEAMTADATTGEETTKQSRIERLRLVKKKSDSKKQNEDPEEKPVQQGSLWNFGSVSEHQSTDTKEHVPSARASSPRLFKSRSNDSEGRGDEDYSMTSRGTEARSEASSKFANVSKLFGDSRTQIKTVYHSFGEADVLQVEKGEDGIPTIEGSNHVIIKVQASTVTLNDCLLRRGFDFNVLYPISLPATPGADVVGNIVKTGDDVKDFVVGDRVAALVRSGGNARFISVPVDSLVKVPHHLDSAEVAAMVSIYTTAYQALRKITGGSPMFSLYGKKVLVLGGMDGVGQALIQLLKKAKAEIYATAPKQRHIYLKNVLGANPLPEADWLPAVEGQLDYAFDGVCENGAGSAFKALKDTGELICYGNSAMLKEKDMGLLGVPMSVRMNQLYCGMSFRVHTIDIFESFRRDPKTYKDDLETLCRSLKWNKLRPHIAKRVSLKEVASAQKKLEDGEIRGTVVCFPWRPVIGNISNKGEERMSLKEVASAQKKLEDGETRGTVVCFPWRPVIGNISNIGEEREE